MTGSPHREPPTGTERHYSRPPVDTTDEEIEAWVEHFVDAVLGALPPQDDDRR